MKIVVDTNWLVAAYFKKLDHPRTDIVTRFGERYDLPWILPQPALLEARNVFAAYAKSPSGEEWRRLQGHIGTKLLAAETGWDSLATRAQELCDRFSHKARLGTFDLMILATALKVEATHFLSFDSGSNTRALAAHLKLKVFPELTADDKRRIAAFR